MQIGPYTIERELGRGGMGAVYLGRSAPGAPPVAIKVVRAGLSTDPEVAARFRAEAEALQRLEHPHLIRFRGRGQGPGGTWIAMDYVEGQSLAEHLAAGGPWSNEAARALLLDLAAGIAQAHHQGVLHRDLKPENVLLRAPDQHPLIVDFGLARPLDLSQHLTATGEILGSPGYLAPEQCGSGERPSLATDVYGLGALLYAVLTGSPPFQAPSVLATLDQVLSARPRPPRELQPEVAPWLEAICLRCLAKDPSERYPDAATLADALLAGPSATNMSARPRWGRWFLAAGAGIAALGLLWGALSGGTPPPAESQSPSLTPPLAPTPSPTPERWREGPWGAKHAALGEADDPDALRARRELLAREASEIDPRAGPWVARRARALLIAKRAAERTPEAGLEWLQTLALDDVYGDSLDSTADLLAARELARRLASSGDTSVSLEFLVTRARIELAAWRRSRPEERERQEEKVLAAWSKFADPDGIWWREAVRVELKTASAPEEALDSLARIEDAAASPSAKAWVEFLRARFLRLTGANAEEYLELLQTVATWPGASATLRANAALTRASRLDHDHDPRTRGALEAVQAETLSPWRRLSLEFRLARCKLRAGDLEAARAFLAKAPADPSADLRFPFGLLRVELLAREGRLADAERALVAVPQPRRDPETERLLYLRAVLGQADHAQALVARIGATRDHWGHLAAHQTLERAARDPLWKARAPLEQLAAQAQARLQNPQVQAALLKGLHRASRWRELIAVSRLTLAESDPRRYANLVAHALTAAEELDVPRAEILRAAREAASAIRGISPPEAQGQALLGSFALRQTLAQSDSQAQARRVTAYAETLERAKGGEEGLELWPMGWTELIRLYTWAAPAHPEFRGLAAQLALRWTELDPKSLGALKAACDLAPSDPRLKDLSRRVQSAEPFSLESLRAALVVLRLRRLSGDGLTQGFVLAHEPLSRRAIRRGLQLEEARSRLMRSEPEAAALILRRVQGWCPPEPPSLEFALLLARAQLEAGELEACGAALARARQDPRASPAEISELLLLEARQLQLAGAPREEFGVKLVAGVAAGLTASSSLDYARMIPPDAAAITQTYGVALGYERSPQELTTILREVAAKGGDPVAALEIGARELSLRADAGRALKLLERAAQLLEPSDGLTDLLTLSVFRVSRSRLSQGLPLPKPRELGFLRGARAPLAQRLMEAHRIRQRVRDPKVPAGRKQLLELLAALTEELRAAPPEVAQAWDLASELAQLEIDLARSSRTRAEREERAARAEAILAEAAKTGPLVLTRARDRSFLLGDLLRRPERAAEVLEAAIAAARERHQQVFAGTLARSRAIYLFRLGRFSEALADLDFAVGAGLEPALRGEAYLQRARALACLDRYPEAADSVRRARVSIPSNDFGLLLEAAILEARWGSANLLDARRRLEFVLSHLPQLQAPAQEVIRGMVRVARAELHRREGRPERALEELRPLPLRARFFPPGAVDERLACYAALGARGRADLLEWGPAALASGKLFSYQRARVRAALEAARAEK